MNTKLYILIIVIFALTYGCKQGNKENEVAILKYVTHPALDEMENAYYARLDSLLVSSKENWIIKKYNANASATSASTIAKSFSQNNVGLIFTIATPAAIAVSKNTSDIPHIYGAVADPKGAKIIPSKNSTGMANAGKNIIQEALLFIKSTFGENVRIGTIYNPQEQNSIYIQNLIKSICKENNISLKQVTVQSPSNLNGITNQLCKAVDVIYSANDNTVNSGVTTITTVATKYETPFIIGDLSTLEKGALFAIGLEYKSMGEKLADISYQIIANDSLTISSFPPLVAPKPEIWVNKKIADKINFAITDSLVFKNNIKIK